MTSPSAAAWRIVQIGELVRRAEQLHLAVMHVLPPEASAEISEGAVATMTAVEIEEIATHAGEAAEIADQIRQLAQSLPGQDIEIGYAAIREAAAADLAHGVLDPERVLVAARVLDVRTGWPALAEGLRAVDIRESWTGWAPRGMLSSFRGAGRQLVGRALELTGIPPETGYADCTPRQLVRLAQVIDELGRGCRP